MDTPPCGAASRRNGMNPLSSSVPWKYFALGLALALITFVVLLFLNNASKFIYINF